MKYTKMKTICAYCRTDISEGDPDVPDNMISHGVCGRCLVHVEAEFRAIREDRNEEAVMQLNSMVRRWHDI